MAKYAISEEGANALRNMSSNMLTSCNNILGSSQMLKESINGFGEKLGIYYDEIQVIINKNVKSLSENKDDIVQLAVTLGKKADDVMELVSMGLGDTALNKNPLTASELSNPKTLTRDRKSAIAAGMNAIDNNMNARLDDLHDKGIWDNDKINEILKIEREKSEIELYDDVYGKVDDMCITCINSMRDVLVENNWTRLTEAERGDALNLLAEKAGEAFRTDILGVRFFQADSSSRGYYSGDKYLYINSDCLSNASNRLDAIDTIFHEGRHAFQHAAIDHPSAFGISSEIAEGWKNNFTHYLSSEKFGYERYYQQPVEADAFGFADNVIRNGGI